MAPSVTLRVLLGLADQPAPLRDSVLIMIDCQDTYRHGVMQLEGAEPALAEATRLLARARGEGVPVFHRGVPYVARLFTGLRRPRHGVRDGDCCDVQRELGGVTGDERARP